MKKITAWFRYHFTVPHDPTDRLVRRLEREGQYGDAWMVDRK